jgi:hypothetical protein
MIDKSSAPAARSPSTDNKPGEQDTVDRVKLIEGSIKECKFKVSARLPTFSALRVATSSQFVSWKEDALPQGCYDYKTEKSPYCNSPSPSWLTYGEGDEYPRSFEVKAQSGGEARLDLMKRSTYVHKCIK